MQKKSILVALIMAAALLAGCGERTQTVSWYRAHAQDMTAKLAKCNGNPGEALKMPNCINAATADNQIRAEKYEAETAKSLAALRANPRLNWGKGK